MKITKDNIEAVKAFAEEWDRMHPMPEDGNIAVWLIENQAEYEKALEAYLNSMGK